MTYRYKVNSKVRHGTHISIIVDEAKMTQEVQEKSRHGFSYKGEVR